MSINNSLPAFETADLADFESNTYLTVFNQDRFASQAMRDLDDGEFFDAAISSLSEAEAAKALNDSEAAKQALRMVGILIGKGIEVTAAEIELMDLPQITPSSPLLEVPNFIHWASSVNLVATSHDFLFPGKIQSEIRLYNEAEELTASLEEEIYSKPQAELIHKVVLTACDVIRQSTPRYQDEKLELMKFAQKAAEFHELGDDPECDEIAYNTYLELIRTCRFIDSPKVAPYVYAAGEKLLDIAHSNDEPEKFPVDTTKAEVLSALRYVRDMNGIDKRQYNSQSLRLLAKYSPIDWFLISSQVELL